MLVAKLIGADSVLYMTQSGVRKNKDDSSTLYRALFNKNDELVESFNGISKDGTGGMHDKVKNSFNLASQGIVSVIAPANIEHSINEALNNPMNHTIIPPYKTQRLFTENI